MDILNGFLSEVLKDVACGTINQLQYFFYFNSFAKELQKEEDNLVETIKNVDDRVIYARRQTLKTADVIDKWLKKANIDSEDVNRLLEETNAKKSCFFGYFPNLIWRYRLGKKLAIKKVDLQKIIEEGRQYIQLERIASIPSNTFDILTEKSMNFESRKSAFDKLMEALKDDGIAMIGLYGMGGCGKTTLAMEVKKIADAKHLFHKVIFVPVSTTVEVSTIQDKIASSLQFPFPENQEMERSQRLCMRLMQEKKILMILDDVWEKLDFGRIGIPSSEYHKGCKILITTRLEEVCISMNCQKKIYLPILTDEEAWTLFQNKAPMSKNIKHLAKSISDECKGLPVAIVAVASSLNGKEEAIWLAALNKLKRSKPINTAKGLRDPYNCLQLSYDNLDTEETKSLFLLCSVFPEDYEISVESLIRYAIGLGVVGEVETYEEARTEVTEAKMKLVSSCLILKTDNECVKMHDLVRDVAHWIAKNENKMIKCELEKDVSLEQGSIRYLWCVKFPVDMDCSNLEFLSIQINLEVSDAIFERMGKLRVLIITNKENYMLQLSTISFKALTNLRCMILQNWKLSDISFVRDMKKLQSLSFHYCSWPSFLGFQSDVTSFTNLKLLEFNRCNIESKIFEEIKRIPFLEELYILEIFWRDNDEENVKFFKSFGVPQTLQRFGIILGCFYFDIDYTSDYISQEFYSYERTLGINYFDMSNEVIKGLAKKAKELFVGNIEGGAKNIIPDIFEIEEGMNELKQLRIRDCEEIECLVDTSNHLNNALWHGCLPSNRPFEKLEKIYIKDCPQLTSLFTYVIAQGMTELKILHIYFCSILKHILADDDKTKKSEDEFTIENSVQSRIFENLQVKVYACGELKHVFSASITGGLPQLKIFHIAYCNMLEQIFEDALPPAHHEETNEIVEEDEHQHFESNQLRFSPRITSFPSAPIVHNTSSGSFSLSSLTNIEIYSCPRLGSLFTTSVAKTLTSLEELEIIDCHGLKHIVTPTRVKTNKNMVEDIYLMFSNLKKIFISYCDSLQNIFATPVNGCFEKLEELDMMGQHFPAQQTLRNANTGDWMMGQQLSFKLEFLRLTNLPEMTHIWVATNSSFTLKHLNFLVIEECEKLELVFPRSVLRCLPELNLLQVRKCEELRQIIEEDLEDKRLSNILSPQPCFPKLESLFIQGCHKLKCFTSIFASNDLSNLNILIITGATELQEFIACEYDETRKTKIELPHLKLIIFINLSNFHQKTIFSNVKHRIIRNCPKLSLTSTTTPQELQQNLPLEGLENSRIPYWQISSLMDDIKKLDEVSRSNNSTELPSSQEWDPTPKNTSPLQMNREDPSTSEIKPCFSQVNDDNQSMLESKVEMVGQHIENETKTIVPEIQEFKKIDKKSEMTSNPQAMEQNFPVISSPNMIERTHQKKANNTEKTTTSDKLAIPTSALENIEKIGRQRTKDGPLPEEAAIKTHKSNEVTRDIRTRLEECKHLGDLDDSQISLLVEAISAYPHLWKACEKFSDRFQALMLRTLTDMLLFLRSESVGSVNPLKEKEFLKLCDVAVQLGFEKSWVDEMRQRVVGRDPKLYHAKARIGDLLKRHTHLTQELHNLTQELQNMKIELMSLHDYIDVSTKCFDFL